MSLDPTPVTLPGPLAELKEYARLHARNQGLSARDTTRILDRIDNDTPGSPSSWTRVWRTRADELAARGRLLDACRHYTLARFPYPYDEPRHHAQQAAVETFNRWRTTQPAIERIELPHPTDPLACWATGLDRDRPLLLVMGGIISVKEQWAPLLPRLSRMGYAAVVAELPGVGENTHRYTPDSWRLLPHLLDALAPRARTDATSLLFLSFSGHLALRAAAADTRIRRILTVGAPVSEFFTDADWWQRLPSLTRDTLRRLTATAHETELRTALRDFALAPTTLRDIDASVRYVASTRDEIIPPTDPALLSATLADIRIKQIDDVHGSPGHPGTVRRWLAWNLRGKPTG
ncbi:alpha/beta hydrolase [Streptomyces sp. NPDC051954]|uniref:alpha/beta fold hydrolase n=1 Tax=unclassified Streptomyces TaxID=2593676 RepID=UPI0034392468